MIRSGCFFTKTRCTKGFLDDSFAGGGSAPGQTARENIECCCKVRYKKMGKKIFKKKHSEIPSTEEHLHGQIGTPSRRNRNTVAA